MTQDEIIEMAREAHRKLVTEVYVGHIGQLDPWTIELLKIFAKLVAAKEREALAQSEPTNIERHEANVQKFLGAPQPEQEPVAWMDADGKTFPFVWNVSSLGVRQGLKYLDESLTPLYTTPPQRTWVGLTDEERKNIMVECESTGDWAWELNAAQAIEAKLKEKNT